MLFSQARQGFAFYHQVANHSKRTAEGYDAILSTFERFLLAQTPPRTSIENVTRADVQQFIAHTQSRETKWQEHPFHKPQSSPLSPFTVHTYFRCLHSFFNWALREQMIRDHPMTGIPKPKLPKSNKPRFSEAEIERLLHTCSQGRPALAARNRALLLFLLDTGARASEVCGLTLDRLDPQLRRALVIGKGMKNRYLILGARTRQALWEYLNVHRPAPQGTNAVFLTAWGKPLDKNKLAHILHRLGKAAGVEGVHCHRFCHTCARMLLRNGATALHLQAILGHESLETVSIYARLETEDIEQMHERCSPVDRLGL